ncbi:MAG: SGNH/GDSL hydrolase family protein [Prochlorococcaceae cyanobacterium]
MPIAHRLLLAATALAVLLPAGAGQAGVRRLDRLVVIGDSLSDGGNSGLLTQTVLPPSGFPPSPYVGGRVSNGPVAVEQLWRRYHSSGPGLKPSLAGGTNFAVAGATSGSATALDVDPNLPAFLRPSYANTGASAQLQAVLATPDPNPNRSLYVVWLGGNDGLYWFNTGGSPTSSGSTSGTIAGGAPVPGVNAFQMIGNAVSNVVSGVAALMAKGARHILVPNLPDFGLAPAYIGTAQSPLVSQLVVALNAGVETELQKLQVANPTVDLIRFDTYGLFNEVRANPGAFGFDNTSKACLLTNPQLDPCNPDRWLFWDGLHPTTAAHALIADRMYGAIHEVPGPLPLAGVAAAFGWGRRLRRRQLKR